MLNDVYLGWHVPIWKVFGQEYNAEKVALGSKRNQIRKSVLIPSSTLFIYSSCFIQITKKKTTRLVNEQDCIQKANFHLLPLARCLKTLKQKQCEKSYKMYIHRIINMQNNSTFTNKCWHYETFCSLYLPPSFFFLLESSLPLIMYATFSILLSSFLLCYRLHAFQIHLSLYLIPSQLSSYPLFLFHPFQPSLAAFPISGLLLIFFLDSPPFFFLPSITTPFPFLQSVSSVSPFLPLHLPIHYLFFCHPLSAPSSLFLLCCLQLFLATLSPCFLFLFPPFTLPSFPHFLSICRAFFFHSEQI